MKLFEKQRICQLCRKDFTWVWEPFKSCFCPHCGQRQKEQTIEIDCPPGHPRPGDLYPDVIAGTGLPERPSAGRVFGNWIWDYNDLPREQWEKAQPILKERITRLYKKGIIRYGSW